jgi:4-cresol dehydrogenase (hydroxylating)
VERDRGRGGERREDLHPGGLGAVRDLRREGERPPNIGHLAFSPVVPLLGSEVERVERLLSEFMLEHLDDNLSAGAAIVNERSLVFVCNINLVLDDEAQVRRAYDTLHRMVEHFGALGYSEYRAHLDIMDVAASQASFGDHAYRRFVESIKDAVDPNGILSPGRHGIWPAAYRTGGPGSPR